MKGTSFTKDEIAVVVALASDADPDDYKDERIKTLIRKCRSQRVDHGTTIDILPFAIERWKKGPWR